jgi:hypothetical protein
VLNNIGAGRHCKAVASGLTPPRCLPALLSPAVEAVWAMLGETAQTARLSEVELSWFRLIAQATEQLSTIAKVPTENLEKFADDVQFIFFGWPPGGVHPFGPGAASQHPTVKKGLWKIKQESATLRRDLLHLRPQIQAMEHRRPKIRHVIRTLEVLEEALRKEVGDEPGRHRPRGHKRYPGLESLVFLLEEAARCNAGRFTLNKRDGKGTLIYALDWLRCHLEANLHLRHLAELVPAPGQHPYSIYERVLLQARSKIP